MTQGRASRRPRWLTRNLLALSAVSLLQDSASELVYPLLPLLLTGVLGAPAVVVGLVESVAEGVASATKYLAGRLSDRTGRKPVVATGYSLAAAGKVVVAAAGSWPVVLVGRSVDRLGKGVRGAPRDALLAEGVPDRELGRVFGFHRAADTLGAVIGPLLGLLALTLSGGDIRTALWWAVPPAILSAVAVAFARERRRSTPAVSRPERVRATGRGRLPRPAPSPLPLRARRVVLLLGLVALVNFPDALVLLRVSEVGFTAQGVVGAYVLYNLAYALGSLPAGRLADTWPRARVYALGLACFAIGYTGLAIADGTVAVLLLLVVYGGFNACTDGVGKAWISSLVPADLRGRAQGVFQATTGGAVLVAGLWAGLLWEVGPGSGVVPLAVSGVVGGACAIGLALSARRLG